MNDPRKVTLNRVTFHTDSQAVSYQFTLDGQQRVVTYRFAEGGAARIDVRQKVGGDPFIELRATRNGIQARTPDGEFALSRRKRVLPASTDQASIWLLAQDFVKNTTTAPGAILDRAWEVWSAQNDPVDEVVSGNVGWPGALWALIQLWEWLGGSGGCLNPDQETQCTETDAQGNDKTIDFKCDCGTPICNQSTTSVDTLVAVTDSTTGEIRIETVPVVVVQCFCYCIEMTAGSPA